MTKEMAKRRRRAAWLKASDMDAAFFEAFEHRRHRVRQSLPWEFGNEERQQVLVRLEPDGSVIQQPLTGDELPDDETVLAGFWLHRNIGVDRHGDAPFEIEVNASKTFLGGD